MKRVALYARVSTVGQTVENQIRELEAVGERLGWEVGERYIDQGVSGAKGREQRPALDSLLKAVIRGEIGFLATFDDHAASRNRRPSRSSLARPYIWRLSVLSRLIRPSTGPVLHGSVAAARPAPSPVPSRAAKPRNAGGGPPRARASQ